jgi:toxin-antitoxin system PIN domain toxin
VILIDTNLLLYAGIDSTADHERAREWLDTQFASASRIGLPWHSLLGFVRLASSRRIFPDGPSVDDAWQLVRKWLGAEGVWVPQPTEQHGDILNDLFSSTGITSRSVRDVHLAALAIEHGLTLCSADTGFARFKKLRWENPLA